ncbi:beta family protein [Kineosporia succinea]|uniref:T4 beta protein n=1 Tax=Kineosporia succinea TaxID=84632 RepID=A0ABT9P714_9ACTN|nr:beta family protein [Kineosporia succinea]MDP9828346.1 hypothetical protein [Kineosporia succinea]
MLAATEPPLYVPVLRGHLGEFDALEMMAPATRSRSYPLIVIVPDVETKPHEPWRLAERFATLSQKWEGRIMVDGSRLTDRETRGDTGLRTVMDAARGPFTQAVPVVRLKDDAAVRFDAADAVRQDGNGVAVQVRRDDLFVAPALVARQLSELLHDVGVQPEQTDLLLDLGYVADDAAAVHGSRLVDRVLSETSGLARYRTVVLTAGAFPPDSGTVRPQRLTEVARHDAALWEYLKARDPERLPVYGDYAITHPGFHPPSSGEIRRPSPHLRYTVAARWLVLRGRRDHPRRNAQFYDICQEISADDRFCGAGLGPADGRIADARSFGPGAAKDWIAVGTAHHADFVVDALARTGLP